MSAEQYIRQCSIVLANAAGKGIDVAALRCVFHIERGDYQTPNMLTLRVYNVAPSTAAQMQTEFTQIAVQAGYTGNFGLIFNGTIMQVRRGRENAEDDYVDVTAADGDEAYNYAFCAFNMPAGSSNSQKANSIIGVMAKTAAARKSALSAGYLAGLDSNGDVRGSVHFGPARKEMRILAQSDGLSWSIQDGKVQMVPLNAYMPGTAPVLSSTTGLIGVPEQTADGINIRVLLNPNIKIGQTVRLKNSAINQLQLGVDQASQFENSILLQQIQTNADGLYYVMRANHHGDTRGDEWFSDLVCLSVDATVTQPGILEGTSVQPAVKITAVHSSSGVGTGP